jgi:hypothetical protein
MMKTSAIFALFAALTLAGNGAFAQTATPAQTAPPAAAKPAKPTTPASPLDFSPSGELNKNLPKWLQFAGEYRSRVEGYSGGSYKPVSTDSYILSRLRLMVTIKPVSWFTLYGEGADIRVFEKSPAVPPFQNTWDIRQAYAEIGNDKEPFTVRVGRTELNYGEQRLIGASPWANAARVFDAVRGTYKRPGVKVDVFSASVVNAVDGTWDHHLQGNNLHGVYSTFDKLVPNAVVEAYGLWRTQPRVKNEAGVIANLDEKIAGLRFVGKLPMGFDYGTELVNESGYLGSDKVQAWAGHFVGGFTPAKVRFNPRMYFEYNYATGDHNAKDGIRGTFDQLYPSGHDKIGMADLVGWKNVKDARLGVETKPIKKITANFAFHDVYLADPNDSLYNATGAAVAKSATGTAGTHVGQELDLSGMWTMSKTVQVGAGVGHLFPGEFVQKTTPGVAYSIRYLMATWKF